jgi:hypothetical protein
MIHKMCISRSRIVLMYSNNCLCVQNNSTGQPVHYERGLPQVSDCVCRVVKIRQVLDSVVGLPVSRDFDLCFQC